ncbi:acyl-CoA thioesterase [Streptomyces antarcticus]|uniref:acyl-CoA thioesterase n=1 Tax=Streptomyces antarcticus TaxID=2996458 RepID=UPI002271C003|nr:MULTISPECIES: thioesterase family protein [unclassified Streptomyces]MCY0942866.1 thioesterase family protein [Streptomyces sp. H34-AA3]MCY0953087.1 thioesterase family protein [Streptomyces sp. H27-S2]MCZ4087880.1 thioesterase family protein [Streptomyces sp. H34-S5]
MTRHTYPCPIRWSDMDIYGIVNNVSFVRYLEEARVDFIFRMAPTEGDAFFREGSVVVSHQIRYRSRLVHRHEPVDIEMWVSDLQSATVTIDYAVRDGDLVYATASTTMAPFDYRAGRPRRLTDAETGFFEKYLEETASAR